MWPRAQLLVGNVLHQRQAPLPHSFVYPMFSCLLPMQRLDSVRSPVFSLNRFNLLSWHAADHGARDGSDPMLWLRAQLTAQGLADVDGEVWLQTFPRMLGYVFNPVSFWYCHDRQGALRAVLAEVSNTFGERHNYLVAHADRRPIVAGDSLRCDKVFHVSPFFPVNGFYLFRFALSERRVAVCIEYFAEDNPRFLATISGSTIDWSTAALLRTFASYPWMTLRVVLRIHWQAALLFFRRRARFHRKPEPPALHTTR